MGYRVKQQCFNDLEHAKAVYFSQVAPAINANGQLMQIEHIGQEYVLNGQVLQASFAACEPTRLFRRQFILSHATLAGSSSWR